MARGLIVALGAITAAPCFAQPAADASGKGQCSEAAARFAIGQTYSAQLAEGVRQVSGARIVRRIVPGGVYTMELRADQLNVETNAAGTIQRVRCG